MKKINGECVYLRELNSDDASIEYCNWLNDETVNKYLETRESTIKSVKDYIKKQVDNPNSFFVGIFDKENDKHLGNIKLEPIDWENKSCVFGILIGDKNYWGKGIGTEATKLILDYAFKNMKLKSVNLGVIAENKRAIRVYEKVGFKIIGINKNKVRHGDKLFDEVKMSVGDIK